MVNLERVRKLACSKAGQQWHPSFFFSSCTLHQIYPKYIFLAHPFSGMSPTHTGAWLVRPIVLQAAKLTLPADCNAVGLTQWMVSQTAVKRPLLSHRELKSFYTLYSRRFELSSMFGGDIYAMLLN